MLILTALAFLPVQGPLPTGHPLCKDRTGLHWVLPFAKARAAAKEHKRLLMIKPVAFGTTPDGGW